MFLNETRANRLAEPVGVNASVDVLETLFSEIVQRDLIQRIVCGAGVPSCSSFKFQFLPRIHQVIVRQVGHCYAEISLERE